MDPAVGKKIAHTHSADKSSINTLSRPLRPLFRHGSYGSPACSVLEEGGPEGDAAHAAFEGITRCISSLGATPTQTRVSTALSSLRDHGGGFVVIGDAASVTPSRRQSTTVTRPNWSANKAHPPALCCQCPPGSDWERLSAPAKSWLCLVCSVRRRRLRPHYELRDHERVRTHRPHQPAGKSPCCGAGLV